MNLYRGRISYEKCLVSRREKGLCAVRRILSNNSFIKTANAQIGVNPYPGITTFPNSHIDQPQRKTNFAIDLNSIDSDT